MENMVVYQDRDLIVFNKPAGLPTQASEKAKGKNLYQMAKEWLKETQNHHNLALHHRLDSATSGLILFGKNPYYNRYYTDLFREKRIVKAYHALVDCKSAPPESWTCDDPITTFRFKHFKKSKTAARGKEAITHFKTVEVKGPKAMIECRPETGRLHQIRVHLKASGFPVQGDFHYNPNWKDGEFSLCASLLEFRHPRTKELLTLKIDPPFSLLS